MERNRYKSAGDFLPHFGCGFAALSPFAVKRAPWYVLTLTIFCLSSSGCHSTTGKQAESKPTIEVVKSISETVPMAEALVDIQFAKTSLIGRYGNPGLLLEQRAGPALSRHSLHLLADSTYRYEYSADILQSRLCDQGKWGWENGMVVLRTDGSIKGIANLNDNKYVPFTFKSGKARSLMLIGATNDLRRFQSSLKPADSDKLREVALLLCSFEKISNSPVKLNGIH